MDTAENNNSSNGTMNLKEIGEDRSNNDDESTSTDLEQMSVVQEAAFLNEEESQTSNLPEQHESFKQKRKRRTSNYGLFDQIKSCLISVENLFIYTWPPTQSQEPLKQSNIQETFVLQEQISEYLCVKSFKRKYPDLSRRLIELKEREFLKENKVVTETQCDLGLTALKLNECLDIMADHYPEKYTELNAHLKEKRRRDYNLAAERADIIKKKPETSMSRPGRVAMNESERLKELIKKAVQSASNYNAHFQREKKAERKSYFDLQTMRIQTPSFCSNNPSKSINPNGQYPVALLHGQYQYYYKRYTSDQLKCLPINSVLHTTTPLLIEYEEWKKQQLVQDKAIDKKFDSSDDDDKTNKEIDRKVLLNGNQTMLKTANIPLNQQPIPATGAPNSNSFRITISAAPTVANLISAANKQAVILPKSCQADSVAVVPVFKKCNICTKSSQINIPNFTLNNTEQFMVHCSSCDSYSHPNCLELNPKLVNWQCIMQYEWQCMDCKRCSKCNNPHDEDKMMFCDRCDRGFHTYCVGLGEVPTGSWICKQCENYSVDKSKQNGSLLKMNETSVLSRNEFNTPPRTVMQHIRSSSVSSLNKPNNSTGKRGRPPGSLNKPKDPNSPKKLLKNKLKKVDQNSSYSNCDINNYKEETSVDGLLNEDHSQSLSFENFNNIIGINMNENFMQCTF